MRIIRICKPPMSGRYFPACSFTVRTEPRLPRTPAESRPLSHLKVGERAIVAQVEASDLLARRLLEIGFYPGAVVEVVAAMWPGDDPLAVRVGGATFALRRHEADGVTVE